MADGDSLTELSNVLDRQAFKRYRCPLCGLAVEGKPEHRSAWWRLLLGWLACLATGVVIGWQVCLFVLWHLPPPAG